MLIRSSVRSIRAGINHAMKLPIFFVLMVLWSYPSHIMAATAVAVDPPQKGRSDAPPTMTLLYGVDNAVAPFV